VGKKPRYVEKTHYLVAFSLVVFIFIPFLSVLITHEISIHCL